LDESFAVPQTETSLESAVKYCGLQVRSFDPDRYLTAIAAPKEFRSALLVLYAFNLEISKIRETVSEPMLGRIRLQWWREAIEGIFHGTPRNHEVVMALASIIKGFGLSRELFDDMINGREFDLEERAPHDIQELESYARSTSGNLLCLVAEITGADSKKANRIGTAWAFVGLLKSVDFHRKQQCCYLPGVSVSDIDTEQASLAFQTVLKRSSELINLKLTKEDCVLRLHHWISRHDLKRLEKTGFNPFAPGGANTPWRRFRIILAALIAG